MSDESLFDPHEFIIERFMETLLWDDDALAVSGFLKEISDDAYLLEVCHQIIDIWEGMDGVL